MAEDNKVTDINTIPLDSFTNFLQNIISNEIFITFFVMVFLIILIIVKFKDHLVIRIN